MAEGIQDVAGNLFITQTVPMIGFSEPAETDERQLRLRMYFFITENIRALDQSGTKFLERYLLGPETVWKLVDAAIRDTPVLWNVADIPGRFLQFLKRIVGWTPDTDSITDGLDELTLRRMIAAAVPFWKRRGPEDSITDLLRLVTGARHRIWNWFDFRIVLDESAFGEDWNGYDPWMISLPGPPNDDDRRFNVRIVDDGTLNHRLVRDLIRLTRPVGERVEISYIRFLDLFAQDADDSQWDTSNVTVEDGELTAGANGFAIVAADGAELWTNYTYTSRIRGRAKLAFYRTDEDNYYFVFMDIANNRIQLSKRTAGAETLLSTTVMSTMGVVLSDSLLYAIRVEAVPEAGDTRMRVFFESALVADVLDADHIAGSIAVIAGSTAVDLDEVELFANPLQTDTIDINS